MRRPALPGDTYILSRSDVFRLQPRRIGFSARVPCGLARGDCLYSLVLPQSVAQTAVNLTLLTCDLVLIAQLFRFAPDEHRYPSPSPLRQFPARPCDRVSGRIPDLPGPQRRTRRLRGHRHEPDDVDPLCDLAPPPLAPGPVARDRGDESRRLRPRRGHRLAGAARHGAPVGPLRRDARLGPRLYRVGLADSHDEERRRWGRQQTSAGKRCQALIWVLLRGYPDRISAVNPAAFRPHAWHQTAPSCPR